MTVEELIKFREKLKEEQAKIPEDERKMNVEFRELLQKYKSITEKGIPFDMPITFEDLKEAVETKRPFEEWEEYKNYYTCILPDDAA